MLVNILANRLPEVEAERVVDTLAKVTTEAVVKTLRWRLDNRNRQAPLPSPRPVCCQLSRLLRLLYLPPVCTPASRAIPRPVCC